MRTQEKMRQVVLASARDHCVEKHGGSFDSNCQSCRGVLGYLGLDLTRRSA